jgi:WXG100 family type VII secretion target
MGTLSMNSDEFRGTGTTVTNESGNFASAKANFLSAANSMTGVWEGADKDAFDNVVNELKPLLEKAEENLGSVGSDMTKTGNDADATTESNVGIINSSI